MKIGKTIFALLVAIGIASGLTGTAVANDDVLKLSKDPANVVMPSITYNGWNYSTLDQINLTNVKNLSVAWTMQIGILDSHEASPLVVGDTMYIVSPKPNYVYALDLAKEGVIKWEFRPTMDVALATAQVCCGAQTRGLYYAEGKIFYATLDGQLIGLDAKSGEQLWRSVGTDIARGEGMSGNALVVHNLFIGGNSGGERGARGKMHAYDINTGKNQWTMYSMGPNNETGVGPKFKPIYPNDKVPNPGLDTWWGQSWKTGGGTLWGYFTWDPETDLIHYSTGNCEPENPDYRREWGKIDLDANNGVKSYSNNWCVSQMARSATTGELVWAYQFTPQDTWDLDQPLITPLVDLNIGGQMRKTAIKFSRTGFFYVWDRATGQMLTEPWMAEYNDVYTGVDMTTGRPKYNLDKILFTSAEDRKKLTNADPVAERAGANKPADYTGTEVFWCPGTAARNWENDAWSPRTGLLYTHSDTTCSSYVPFMAEYKPGEGYTTTRQSSLNSPSKGMDGKPIGPGMLSRLQANDPVASKTVWSKWYNDASRTPVMATATDLLFHGDNATGNLEALDARDGKVVWKFRTGSMFNQSPITYSQGGKQYVAIISSHRPTNTAVAANAAADAATRYRRIGTTLYVFKLPG